MKIPEAAMHPDALALLNAIFDHPNDDTPRLVYADWLQEHGHEDYAEFIRLSIQADRGAKSLADRTRLREERFPYWQRIVEVREDAVRTVPVSIHNYSRGLGARVVASADNFLRTVATWWPAITPSRLEVYKANGVEREVVGALRNHLPWLREFQCNNYRSADDHDAEWHTPLGEVLFEALAAPDQLPRLEELSTIGVFPDFSAMECFANSALVLRLKKFYAWLYAPGSNRFGSIHVPEKRRPDAVRLAIHSFLDRHRGSAVE